MAILLIDDDRRLAQMVQQLFAQHGIDCDHADHIAAARTALTAKAYAGCVLDLSLPDGDGVDFCRELRSEPATVALPILMFSARGETIDKVLGLEIGADDYLSKPFEPRELVARVKALLRRGELAAVDAGNARTAKQSEHVLTFDSLVIDSAARTVSLAGDIVSLSGYQFDILLLLAQNAGRVMSRDSIMQQLRGHDSEAYDRSIDVHISRIRSAIDGDEKSQRISTVRGVGYVFNPKVA